MAVAVGAAAAEEKSQRMNEIQVPDDDEQRGDRGRNLVASVGFASTSIFTT
jgi:hypothetical protein